MADKWFRIKDSLTVAVKTDNGTDYIRRSLTHEQFTILSFFIFTLITIIPAVGIVTNLINIYLFVKIGVKEGMEMSLLGLSISDFACSCSNVVRGILAVMYSIEAYLGPYFQADPHMISHFAFAFSVVFYTQSSLLTIYIAVSRCACVVMPLQFKSTFTARRTAGVIVACFVLGVVFNVPNATKVRIVPKFIKLMNQTRLVNNSKVPGKFLAQSVAHMARSVVIPIMSQVLLLTSVFLMTMALRKSAQIRKNAPVQNPKSPTGPEKLSKRDAKVVQQVVLLCVIHLVCTLPTFINGMATMFYRDLNTIAQFTGHFRLQYIVRSIRRVSEVINGSVNILIYLKYNRKCRECYEAHFVCSLWKSS